MSNELIKRLSDKTAIIGVIGLGYVGIPLSISFSRAGYKVIGFDIDASKTESISKGKTYIKHIPNAEIENAVSLGLEATTDFVRARDVDALIICVPTPLDDHREPDLGYVLSTMEMLVPHLQAGQVVSLESTTYPGTTDEKLKPMIEAAGFEVGVDIYLVYSPEREDPGNPNFTTSTIPKVCGGDTESCREVGRYLYSNVIDQVVSVSSTRVAEMSKLLENIHRAVNIGLVNEMKIVADKMGVDIYEVIDAAATKPFGFVPYYPGPGLGGHCIPIDPFYLTWKAREYGVNTRFIELAGEVNSSMPEWVVGKVTEGLNNHKKSINGSRILMLGIAYKKNIDDMRESPSVEIMQRLQDHGATVNYSDPHVPEFPRMRRYTFDLSSMDLTPDTLQSSDCIIVGTNHDAFDYGMIACNASLIVDSRGVYRNNDQNVIHA